jgi:hypothetical protein
LQIVPDGLDDQVGRRAAAAGRQRIQLRLLVFLKVDLDTYGHGGSLP